MKIKDIQSTRKLYHLIETKTKSKIIATVCEKIIIAILMLIYRVKVLFSLKKVNAECRECNIAKKDITQMQALQVSKEYKYDVSILIPVYNVEKYLEECIASILNQKTEFSYEIVFVNDGSTDASLEILNKYKDMDNVNIITQKNAGLAYARNVLLKNAKGKYIFFVDSDDLLAENTIQVLMQNAQKYELDIVQSSYFKFSDNFRNNISYHDEILENDKYKILQMPGFAWGKLIKLEMFDNKIFPSGFLYEDTIMPFLILSQAKKVMIIKDCLYGYRVNLNGIVNQSKKSKNCIDTIWVFEQVLSQMKNNDIDIDYDMYKFIINCQFSYVTYGRIKNMDKDFKIYVFLEMCRVFEKIQMELDNSECFISKNLEKSLREKNYILWYETSKLINYCV
jgi:glycosyltransferase involved in cell wall biosynthesis